MITTLNTFINNFIQGLFNGLTKGLPGGAILTLIWLFTIPYAVVKSILNLVLGFLPGDVAKPAYRLGQSIGDNVKSTSKPLAPALSALDNLQSDRFYRFWAVNLIALAVVTVILVYLGNQISDIIETTDFGVITQSFNAGLDTGFVAIKGDDAIWVALLKGVVNTLMLVIISIVVASLIGLLVGVARLAKHPLISRFAAGYTELFRNIPLLALMLLLSAAVFLQVFPRLSIDLETGEGTWWSIPRIVYISNNGVAVPSFTGADLWWIWLVCLFASAVAALYLRRRLIYKEQETGGIYRPNLYGFALFLGLAVVSYLILFFAFGLNAPVGISFPLVDTETFIVPTYSGGFVISTAFLAALVGLIFYFSAFIAEIVRGSIQAIPHGQTEAANSLGLSAYQRLSLVILPQALTIMIPSLNNEYQNVNKDSAVAFAIGYVEILFVLRQVANERGELVTILIAGLFIYMTVNLIISAIMNSLNRLNSIAR